MGIVSFSKKTIKVIGGYLSIPPCFLMSFFILLSRYRILKRTRDIIFLPVGGFGHTIVGPDVIRRLFGFNKSVLIVFSYFGKHNRKVAHIWPDVTVIFLPIVFGINWEQKVTSFSFSNWYKSNAPNIVRSFFRVLGITCNFYFLDEDIYNGKLIEKFQIKFEGTPPKYYNRVKSNYLWGFYYLYLREKVSAPKVHAPEKIRNVFYDALRRIVPAEMDGKTKLCCIYLRNKDKKNTVTLGDAFGNTRVGSDFACYRHAIKLLNDSGYVVLIVGDVNLSSEIINEYNGMLIDYKAVSINRDWFSMLAPTEADIFIGEAGGGSWLAGINDIPCLLMNAHPYGWCLPNSWMYYKTLRNKNGMLVPMEDVLSEYLYCYRFPEGYTLNSADEIEIFKAVQCFIEDVKSQQPDKSDDIIKTLSDYTWLKHTQVKFSPAWLELYGRACQ